MPTYQMTARKANSQEIEDYQEKIAEKKELEIRNTLCKPLFMLALASLVPPPQREAVLARIAGFMLAPQLAEVPTDNLFTAGAAGVIAGASIGLAEAAGFNTQLTSVAKFVAFGGFTLFKANFAMNKLSAEEILHMVKIEPVSATPA